MNRQSTEDFQGNENTLYDTIMLDLCHYRFFQTHRIHSTKRETTKANYGLHVIMTCQCKFTNYSSCSAFLGDEGNEGIYACMGEKDIQEISIPFS